MKLNHYIKLAILALGVGESYAAEVWVNPLARSGGNGTLDRPLQSISQAVALANSQDEIMLMPGLYQDQANRNIGGGSKSLTFTGHGLPEEIVIDCQRYGSAFLYDADDTGRLAVNNLTIINASSGAIQATKSNVTVRNCHFRKNRNNTGSGGAISIENLSVRIYDSIFTSNRSRKDGGAVSIKYAGNANRSLIYDSVFTGNASYDDGGALYVHNSRSFVRSSLFENNRTYLANAYGGAIYVSGTQAMTYSYGSALVGNSTRRSPGGAAAARTSARMAFYDSTISGNSTYRSGPTIYNESSTRTYVRRSIVWGNNGTSFLTDNPGYRVVTDSDIAGGAPGSGNFDLDPQFGPDGYSLTATSPCRDRLSYVARYEIHGEDRRYNPDNPAAPFNYYTNPLPVGDVGADEFIDQDDNNLADVNEAPTSFNVSTEAEFATALELAREGDTIILMRPIRIANRYVIDKDLTIEGSAFGRIHGLLGKNSTNNGLLHVLSQAKLTLRNICLNESESSDGYGAVINDGYLDISNCDLSRNVSTNNGGAITNRGTLIITETKLFSNEAASFGGGIYSTGTLVMDGVPFKGCKVYYNKGSYGGGVAVKAGNFTIGAVATQNEYSDSEFRQNGAIDGAAIYLDSWVSSAISSVDVRQNVATGSGGAIYLALTPLELDDSNLANNKALNGGGIYSINSDLLIKNSKLYDNDARNGAGGGLFALNTMTTLERADLAGNLAVTGGGAAITGYFSRFAIDGDSFVTDHASGYGLHFSAISPTTVTIDPETYFENNTPADTNL